MADPAQFVVDVFVQVVYEQRSADMGGTYPNTQDGAYEVHVYTRSGSDCTAVYCDGSGGYKAITQKC